MKKSQVHHRRIIPADHQAAKGREPRKGTFDLPAAAIAAQLSPIFRWWFRPVFPVRYDQINPLSGQTLAQRVAVIASVSDQALRVLAWLPRSSTRDGNRLQGRRHQGYLRWGH